MVTLSHKNRELERAGASGIATGARTRDVPISRSPSRSTPDRAPSQSKTPEVEPGREQWENIPSVPGAQVRANGAIGMAEISYEGHIGGVGGLASIKDWSKDHGLTNIEEDRLVELDLLARRRSMTQAAGRSRDARDARSTGGFDDRFDAIVNDGLEHDAERRAAHVQEKSIREKVIFMEQAKPQTPALEAKRVGQNMPKADWQEAINLLKSKAPGEQGRVYLPKERGEYGGQVLLVTDSHVVQRVGRGTAVAHDLSKLSNGKELAADFESGKVKPGHTMRVTYGSEQEGGKATVVPFNQQRATEVRNELGKWAEANISNARGRETFLKHLDAATKEMAAKQPAPREPTQPVPNRAPAPSKDR